MSTKDNILFEKMDLSQKSGSGYFKGDSKGIVIHANIEGIHSYKSLIDDYDIAVNKSNSITIDLVNSFEGISSFDSTKLIVMFIEESYLEYILPKNIKTDEIFNFFHIKQNIYNLKNSQMNFLNTHLAKELFFSPYKGDLEKLFIESKKLEFIFNELKTIFEPVKQIKVKPTKFSKEDKDAIFYAYEILQKELKNPPSIAQLSKKVKLNEFKLKTGFKEFFNTSAYKVSVESRLEEAKNLLKTSELNINEIANETGYKFAENFSSAFYKRFGVRPKELMKSRKYYY